MLGWVFAVEGSARVRVHRDGRGVMQGGRNESGWVVGESLTSSPSLSKGLGWNVHTSGVNLCSICVQPMHLVNGHDDHTGEYVVTN